MAEPIAEPGHWVTVSEAGSRLGWHPDRVKSALRRGRLQARKNNAGKWLVLLTEPPAGSNRANGSADDTLMAGLVDGLRERAAHAEGELAGLRVALAAEVRRSTELQALVADLRRELAEARRGWIERVITAWRRA